MKISTMLKPLIPLGNPNMQMILLADMNPAPYNPRVISESAKRGLKKSIETFGLVEPIVWNRRTGNVVGGHQRFHELVSRKITETNCSVVDLPLEKEKELNLTLNNRFIQGDFVSEDLNKILYEIKSIETIINFTDLGFDKLLGEEISVDKKIKKDFEQKFNVTIICENEIEQKEKFDKIKNELGWNCQLTII